MPGWPKLNKVGPKSVGARMPQQNGCPTIWVIIMYCTLLSQFPPVPTMASKTQRPEGRDDTTVSRLNIAIDALTLTEDVCGIAPTRASFGARQRASDDEQGTWPSILL